MSVMDVAMKISMHLPRGIFSPRLLKDFKGVDSALLLAMLALASMGMIMVASASVGFAAATYGDSLYFFKRHLVYVLMAAGVLLVMLRIPSRLWSENAGLLLAMAIALLILVLIPGVGREVNGSRRWLDLGPFNVQVSELAKLAVIVFMAAHLRRKQIQGQWQNFVKHLAILGLVILLLLLEPDFGSSVVIAATVLVMMFLGGVRLWQFAGLLLVGVAGLVVIAISSPYRMQRLVTFLDPWADQYNSGYQLTQSLIAFGRGEWFGVGLGNSVQKLFYLPEAHTDFVLAIIGEEFGLFGILVVLGLFVLLVTRVLAIARKAVLRQEWFAVYLLFGIAALIAGQAFINVGVTSGLLPTKGLTLPFISYGGSSLLVSSAMVALVLRVGKELDGVPLTPTQRVQRARTGG